MESQNNSSFLASHSLKKSSNPQNLQQNSMSEVWDFFKHIPGSEQWPSSNPKDSPFDEFICKKCGKTFILQMYGSQCTNGKSLEEKALDILRDHILLSHATLTQHSHDLKQLFRYMTQTNIKICFII